MKEYISVDLLKMAIESEPYFTDSTKAAFRNICNKVPAADVVERKRGEWVVTKAYNDVIEMDVVKYTCSACGEYRLSATGLSQATNFCPNCGADMREVDHA